MADVNGRDRQVIPDGRLCSGGIDAYKGLGLARLLVVLAAGVKAFLPRGR